MATKGAGEPGWRMRASDKDREEVVAALRDAYTAGRLTIDEFDERTSAAYQGKTWGDLRALTEDLPEKPELGADLPAKPAVTLPRAPRLDSERMLPASRRSRSRLAPIIAIWLIAGIASHSALVTGLILIVGLVALLVSSFMSGWRDGDHDGHR